MAIRNTLEKVCKEHKTDFVAPPISLCTDNAAMIAYSALAQLPFRSSDDMSLPAKPRMPLDTLSPTMLGHGKKGAKA